MSWLIIVLLYIGTSPGILATIPPLKEKFFASGRTNWIAAIVHGLVFLGIACYLRKQTVLEFFTTISAECQAALDESYALRSQHTQNNCCDRPEPSPTCPNATAKCPEIIQNSLVNYQKLQLNNCSLSQQYARNAPAPAPSPSPSPGRVPAPAPSPSPSPSPAPSPSPSTVRVPAPAPSPSLSPSPSPGRVPAPAPVSSPAPKPIETDSEDLAPVSSPASLSCPQLKDQLDAIGVKFTRDLKCFQDMKKPNCEATFKEATAVSDKYIQNKCEESYGSNITTGGVGSKQVKPVQAGSDLVSPILAPAIQIPIQTRSSCRPSGKDSKRQINPITVCATVNELWKV